MEWQGSDLEAESGLGGVSGMMGAPVDPSTGELRRARALVFGGMFPREAGEKIDGRYELAASIGAGGLGRVYRAHDEKLGRDVAIKFLREQPSPGRRRDALIREAKVLARLQHPNIVAVYDVGEADGELYLSMELVVGEPLDRWLEGDPRGWQDVVPVFEQAAAGLAAAHAAGVIHRDFKPSNVMLGEDGRVRVVDFGLARQFEVSSERSVTTLGDPARTSAAGTRLYMAPEQFEGRPTAASDQFGLCTSLYEVLTGSSPWTGGVKRGVHSTDDPDRLVRGLRAVGVPRWLRRVVLRGVRRDPAERFGSVAELRAALVAPRRVRRMGYAGMAVAGLAAGLLYAGQGDPCEGRGEAAFRIQRAAAETVEPTAALLASYATRWNDLDLSACRAQATNEISGALHDLRARCLDRSLRNVEYLIEQLPNASGSAEQRLEAARLTTDLSGCESDERLLTGQPQEGYDEVLAERLQTGLGRAYVHKGLGEEDEYERLLLELKDSFVGPASAAPEEILLATLLGGAFNATGRYAEAEAVLMPALLRAHQERGWAVDLSNPLQQLATAVANQPGRSGEALVLARQAVAAAASAGHDRAHEITANNALATAALAGGDQALAARASERALELAQAAGEAGDTGWVSFRVNYAEALAIRAAAFVADGERGPAVDHYERALEVLEGGGHAGIVEAQVLNNLGALIAGTEPRRGADMLRAAAKSKERLGMSVSAGASLYTLGNLQQRQGDYTAAIATYDRAAALIGPAVTRDRVKLLYNAGLALQQREDWEEAADRLSTGVEVAAQLGLGDEDPLVYSLLLCLAQVRIEQGRAPDARPLLERARAAEPPSTSPMTQAELRWTLARATAETSPPLARTLCHQALELSAGGGDAELLGKIQGSCAAIR